MGVIAAHHLFNEMISEINFWSGISRYSFVTQPPSGISWIELDRREEAQFLQRFAHKQTRDSMLSLAEQILQRFPTKAKFMDSVWWLYKSFCSVEKIGCRKRFCCVFHLFYVTDILQFDCRNRSISVLNQTEQLLFGIRLKRSKKKIFFCNFRLI